MKVEIDVEMAKRLSAYALHHYSHVAKPFVPVPDGSEHVHNDLKELDRLIKEEEA